MVAHAHQDQEPEGRKIFDTVYLAGVVGIISVLTFLPIIEFFFNSIPFVNRCEREVGKSNLSILYPIVTTFWLLFLIFTFILSWRTNKNLKKLRDIHLKNLPANNVLTYLDTQMLCFSFHLYFLVQLSRNIAFLFDILSWEVSFFLMNMIQVSFDVTISTLFPLYLSLKTRRYLRRLWDNNSPIILQNNDFYAVRMLQISPQSENSFYSRENDDVL